MAKAYVTELTRLCVDKEGRPIQAADLSAVIGTQVVDFTSGEAKTANAFDSKTRFVRVNVSGICSFASATSPTATVNDARMAADATEYFGVAPGQKLSFIANT
jgi:TPP-dependent trihydroxycyclohexane-1,2-dione (THcHDO) dehydratase